MFASYKFLFRLLIFWFGFFAIFRLWFVLQSAKSWHAEKPFRIFLCFYHAVPLDFSFASYLLALPLLLAGIAALMPRSGIALLNKTIFYLHVILIPILILVFGANIFLYEEWNTMLNHRAIQYMKTPAGLLDSMSWYFVVLCVALFVGVSSGFLWLFRRWVMPAFSADSRQFVSDMVLFLLGLPILALGIRGGWGNMPISESSVYYSPHLLDNHAATNTGWHFVHSLIEAAPEENNFVLMSADSAKALSQPLLSRLNNQTKDSLPLVNSSIGDTSLNVVLIIMESMTAQLFGTLGGETGICPSMEKIAASGISFSNIYASGFRTDQGLVSLLSGYPALPDQSVILLEDKMRTLPSFVKSLSGHHYQSGFYYGGELNFANMGQYMYHLGFDKIKSLEDYPSDWHTQKWGVDDKLFLDDLATACSSYSSPFFVTALTLSLHTPFDLPQVSPYKSGTIPDKFRNAATFTDHAIATFLEKAATQPWYKRTLFVFVADHGHGLPGQISNDRPQSRHIPLILYGEPIAKAAQGRVISTFGGHHDLPSTLLALLGVVDSTQAFQYSHNLLLKQENKQDLPSFGYYCNENGIGWATENGISFYDFMQKKWADMHGELSPEERIQAKAFLQTHYQDFIDK